MIVRRDPEASTNGNQCRDVMFTNLWKNFMRTGTVICRAKVAAQLRILIYPGQRCDPPASAYINKLKAFRARPGIIIAVKHARFPVARCTDGNAVEYSRFRADLPFLKLEKRPVGEQLDARNCEFRDCIYLCTTPGSANNGSFVGKTID
jgi:hypothetical protein